MQSLGSRRIEPEAETLEDRIAARLNEALDQMAAGGFEVDTDRGLAVDVWPNPSERMTTYALSVEDVARIAANEAKAWF